MGTCCSVLSVEEAESAQQFRALDENHDNLACQEEMAKYVASRAELWAMLSVNLNLSEEVCRATATRVAMELASGKEGNKALQTELTEAQFHAFRTQYVLDGKGAQEFFHRCVFASFVKEGSRTMDAKELDAFLDTFYEAGSIFEGDARLPQKTELKERILRKNSTGKLSFEQIRDVIRGTAAYTYTPYNNTPTESANPESAPEETPEPKTLAPPSLELYVERAAEPEQTPEVLPIEPAPQKQPRQRKTKSATNKPSSLQESPSKATTKPKKSSSSSSLEDSPTQSSKKTRQPQEQSSHKGKQKQPAKRPQSARRPAADQPRTKRQ